jgi:predicted acyl esterase
MGALRNADQKYLKGQVQSSWFPLVDRNPQKFVDIYKATDADFQKATERIYRSAQYSSHVSLNVMK